MSALTRIGTIGVGLVILGGCVAALGSHRWRQATARLVAQLKGTARATAVGSAPAAVGGGDLPAPVARYFAFALPSGHRPIATAHLRFDGTFAAKPNAWASFTAEQEVTPQPPGFVWDARIAMAPLISVRVRDSYVGGSAAMRASIAGLVPVVNQHGTRELAAASLQRFLAEAVWCPVALLPRIGLSWSAIDDTSARVTLTDGPTTVSLDVAFGPLGEIETVSAMRYRDVHGTAVLTSWVGRHSDYRRIDGMMIPTSGEVAWILPEGRTPYWRGRLVEARFDQ